MTGNSKFVGTLSCIISYAIRQKVISHTFKSRTPKEETDAIAIGIGAKINFNVAVEGSDNNRNAENSSAEIQNISTNVTGDQQTFDLKFLTQHNAVSLADQGPRMILSPGASNTTNDKK